MDTKASGGRENGGINCLFQGTTIRVIEEVEYSGLRLGLHIRKRGGPVHGLQQSPWRRDFYQTSTRGGRSLEKKRAS